MVSFWWNIISFTKMSDFYATLEKSQESHRICKKPLEGLQNPSVFFVTRREALCKDIKFTFCVKITSKCKSFMKFHFCVTESPKSAKCTKPYEFLVQIGWNCTRITQNRLLDPKRIFSPKGDFGAKSALWREKATFGCFCALFRPGGWKHQFWLCF